MLSTEYNQHFSQQNYIAILLLLLHHFCLFVSRSLDAFNLYLYFDIGIPVKPVIAYFGPTQFCVERLTNRHMLQFRQKPMVKLCQHRFTSLAVLDGIDRCCVMRVQLLQLRGEPVQLRLR